ncbi:IS3 family transposase, partial [Thermodesulfobacteriota bacterium]
MSIRRQCRLLHIHRSMIYYDLTEETVENQELMKKLDHLYLEDPSAGSRRMSSYLRRQTDKATNRKRVRRLMRKMGIEAIYPRKRTTIPGGPSGIYPYRLKGLKISRPNQVWCADISVLQQHRVQSLPTLCEKL